MTRPTCCVCGIPSVYCKAHERLTIEEVRNALRISRKSYYRLTEAGKLHPKRVGLGPNGKVLIPRAEVEEMLA